MTTTDIRRCELTIAQAARGSPDALRALTEFVEAARPVTDRRIAELAAMAEAECERGKPESSCICSAWELLAMTAELRDRRARDAADADAPRRIET